MSNVKTTIMVGVFIVALCNFSHADVIRMDGGGECEVLDSQAQGFVLDKCRNDTGKTVNDIHFTFHWGGSEGQLPDVTQDYRQRPLVCLLVPPGRLGCFGEEVEPGAYWDPVDIVIWDRQTVDQISFNVAHVRMDGYWTKDGVRVSEPTPIAVILLGALLLGCFRGKSCNRGQ